MSRIIISSVSLVNSFAFVKCVPGLFTPIVVEWKFWLDVNPSVADTLTVKRHGPSDPTVPTLQEIVVVTKIVRFFPDLFDFVTFITAGADITSAVTRGDGAVTRGEGIVTGSFRHLFSC